MTGKLGSGESKLGLLVLGTDAEEGGTVTTEFLARARIARTETAEFTCRANITHQTRVEFQARARILRTETPQFTCRARIARSETAQFTSRAKIIQADVVGFTCRARIKAQTSATLEATFNVFQRIRAQVPVFYNITAAERKYALFSCQARIRAVATARLAVSFTIDYQVPTDCVVRPTQRINTRTVHQFSARAHIVSSVPPP